MTATSAPFASITGSLPFFDSRSAAFACESVIGSFAVTSSLSGVITSETGVEWSSMKSMSRFEMKPSRREPTWPSSVMGMPEKPNCCLTATTSATVAVGLRQTGSVMKPFLNFFTLFTSVACSSIGML